MLKKLSKLARQYELISVRAQALMLHLNKNSVELNEEGNRLFRELEEAISHAEQDNQ